MKIILIGKGDHSRVVEDAITDAVVKRGQWGEFKIMCRMAESDPDWRVIGENNHFAFIAIGDNSARERLSNLPYLFVNIIHPTAYSWVRSCIGSYFGANSVVGPNSKVGNFCIINTGVILEHDSVVGDYSHLAPGVVTGGRVKIGRLTFVGLNSTIRDGVSVGNNCLIGQGSNVVCDVPDNTVWYGNPATFQKEIK